MFMQVGAMKLFGWPMAMPGGGTVPLVGQMGFGGLWPLVNQRQPAVRYCFIALYLSAAGAGLDALLKK